MWGRAASVAVLTAIAALIVVSSATAAPSWLPTVDVEPTPPISSLVFPVVVAREGGCSSVVFPRGGVLATTRPAGGSYVSPPQTLGTLLGGEYPEAAFGGGVAAAAWLDGSSKLRISNATGCDPFGAAAEVPSTPELAESREGRRRLERHDDRGRRRRGHRQPPRLRLRTPGGGEPGRGRAAAARVGRGIPALGGHQRQRRGGDRLRRRRQRQPGLRQPALRLRAGRPR